MTRIRYCDICRGGGVIRLPVYARLSVADFSAQEPVTINEPSRTFPCPECAATAAEDRVMVFVESVCIDDRCPGKDAVIAEAKHKAAVRIAARLIDEGIITFTERYDPQWMWLAFRATAGVVSSRTVALIREHQMGIAGSVADAAKRAILNWGSRYAGDGGAISKAQVVDAVSGAFRQVEARERG